MIHCPKFDYPPPPLNLEHQVKFFDSMFAVVILNPILGGGEADSAPPPMTFSTVAP